MAGQTRSGTRLGAGTRRTCAPQVVLCKPQKPWIIPRKPCLARCSLCARLCIGSCASTPVCTAAGACPGCLLPPRSGADTLPCRLQALDKAKRQHQEGLRPEVVHARLATLREEAGRHLRAMAPAYSLVILRHSMSQQTWQDRLFFESLYEALIAVVHEALGSLQSREEVEVQVG